MRYRAEVEALDSLEPLGALRRAYLDQLIEAQDALLEAFVAGSRAFALRVGEDRVGYGLVFAGDGLVEFYVTPEQERNAQDYFVDLVRATGAKRALVKSFDHLFLSCASDLMDGVRMRGVLIRHYRPAPLPEVPRIRYQRRGARAEDLERIDAIDRPVFTDRAKLGALVEAGRVSVFERDGELVGFGIVRPIMDDRPEDEVGVVIAPRFHHRGYAVFILRDLVEGCLAEGRKPVCGCARDNLASIRAGMRIGFSGRYRLLEFSLGSAA